MNGRAASVAAQAEPPGPELIAEGVGERGLRRSGATTRKASRVAVLVPQVVGVASAARAPPKKFSPKWLNGSCGALSIVAVIWPVCGSVAISPRELDRDPAALGDEIDRQQAAERVLIRGRLIDRALQRIGLQGAGDLDVADLRGGRAAAGRRCCRSRTAPGCSRRGRRRPTGLIEVPSGRVTTAFFRFDSAIPVGFWGWGRSTSTESAVGESELWVPDCTLTEGSKGTASQPSAPTGVVEMQVLDRPGSARSWRAGPVSRGPSTRSGW